MARKKSYSKFILLASTALLALSGAIFYHQSTSFQKYTHDLPITTKEIETVHNAHGSYLAAFLAQQDKNYTDSAFLFEEALKNDPNNEKLKTTIYLLKAVQGEIESILSLAKDLNTLRKPELLTDYVLISEAILKKDYNTARKLLKEKPTYSTDAILSPVIQAWLYAGESKKEAAIKALEPLKKDLKTKNFYYYYRALIELSLHDPKAAQASFKEMSKLSQKGYPSLIAILFLRDLYQTQGLWHSGQIDFDRITKALTESSALQDAVQNLKSPTNITPRLGVAIAFYDIAVALSPYKLQETCLIFNELALYLAPTATIPKIFGGELLESANNYLAANHVYDRIEMPSDIILLKKAMNLTATEKYSDAKPLLDELEKRNSNDALLLMLIAENNFHLEAYEQAIRLYQKAADLFEKAKKPIDEAQALFALASVYEKQQKMDEVEKILLKAMQLNPNDPLILNYIGYLWLDKGKNKDEALKMVEKAYELKPDDPNIMDSLALGYYQKKDYLKALEFAEKSTDLIAYSSVAYNHLGDIYQALGRTREAKYQYRKALDLTSDLTPELKVSLEKKLGLTR